MRDEAGKVNRYQNIQSFAYGFWYCDLEKLHNLPDLVFSLVKDIIKSTLPVVVKEKCIKATHLISDT